MKRIGLHPLADSTLVETGGTLLSGLLRKDLKVQMSCGGKGLCSTCHVWVKRGVDQLTPVGPRERRTLNLVAGATPESRLACQSLVHGEGVEVEVPEGMYLESADDLIALLGTRAAQNMLHPVTGALLIPKGKLITRSLLEQSRGVEQDLKRVRAEAAGPDSASHRSFLASGSGCRPLPHAITHHASRTVYAAGPGRAPLGPAGSGSFRAATATPPVERSAAPTDPAISQNTSTAPPGSIRPVVRSSGSPSSRSPAAGGRGDRSPAAPQPGLQVGKYLLTECIGQGGAGVVFRALHTKLRTPVAVKFLRPDVSDADPDALARLTREAQLLAQLIHPNIVRVLDYEDDPARPYVVMEFVDGLSVADLLRQSGRVAPARAVEIGRDVLEGLDAARRLGVVHRDVKPGNILLTRDGVSKLVDLGLAVVARPGNGAGGPNLPAAEGTVGYMAPEQAVGGPIDHRADQYSLGCTLYHMLTGRLPFTGRSAHEVMVRHLRAAPDPPHEAAPGVPAGLSRIVLTMMEKAADDRYPDYATLRAELAGVYREMPR